MKEYSVFLLPDPEEGEFTVTVPGLPGIATEGDTEEEALANARDAIEVYLQSLADLGEAAPAETAPARLVTVRVSSPAARAFSVLFLKTLPPNHLKSTRRRWFPVPAGRRATG